MRALSAVLALVLSACATYPDVHTDFDPAANFTAYRTYSWAPIEVPAGMNPLMFSRVQNSVDRFLAGRGYQQSAKSDFIVDLTVVEKERAEVDHFPEYGWGRGWGWAGWGPWGSGWGPVGPYPSLHVDYYTRRSIVVDIYDGADRRAVWHGTVKTNSDEDVVNYAKLDLAVDAVLSRFPPSSGSRK